MKLTAKFLAAMVLSVVVVLGVNGFMRYRREVELFDQDMRADAARLGRVLAGAVPRVWAKEGQNGAMVLLAEASETSDQFRVRWVWLDGKDPARRASLPIAELADLSAGNMVMARRGRPAPGTLYTYVPVDVPGPRKGAIELAESLTAERAYVHTTMINTVVVTLALVAVAAALAGLLGAVVIGRPIGRLAAKARKVGAGDLSGPLVLAQRDELGELAGELNRMCDRLAEELAARQLATEQLRLADRLTTVGKLAAGVAHELGTPLNVVAGRAEMLAAGELSPDETAGNGRIIADQARRMTAIIRQLLDFARPRPPEKLRTDLGAIAIRARSLVERVAARSEVTIAVERALPGGEAPEAEVDEGQIHQVVTNLLINAIQASPNGGQVIVDVARVGAGAVTPPNGHAIGAGPWLRLRVRDTGSGMTEATRARLFEPFFTTKPVGEGTGLGLAVSYTIVREHRGWIDVDSQPAAGSTFSVYLPES